MAAEHLTQWPDSSGSASGPDAVPPRAVMVKLLRGRYEVRQVTTEGVPTPTVERWTLEVSVPDTTTYRPSFGSRASPRDILIGRRTDPVRVTSSGNPQSGRGPGRNGPVEMWVERESGALRWRTAPGAVDAGELFEVAEVDSLGFHGRWVDGGIGVTVLQRDDLRVGERLRGYYCATRLP